MGRPSTTIRAVATIIGLAYAVALYVSGVHLQSNVKSAVGYLPTAATMLVALSDLWLWHLPGIQRVARRPWVTGTWSTTLRPTADSHIPPGGNRGPILAYVVVKQSFWSIAVRQYTCESRSESRAAVWARMSGADLLTYIYENRPLQRFEARSRPHLGTTALDIVGLRPEVIHGEYFTDRYTKGEMELQLLDRTTGHVDFASAQAHCDRTKRADISGRDRDPADVNGCEA